VAGHYHVERCRLRFVENNPIPVLYITVEYSDHTEKCLVATNEGIITLLGAIRPQFAVGQTNQRLRRKWQTQRMFRLSAQDARCLFADFPTFFDVKSRTGLVLIEWPTSEELIRYLTASKQSRPPRMHRARRASIARLDANVERLERENADLRAEILLLQKVIDSLSFRVPLGILLPDSGLQHAQPVLSLSPPACMDACAADRAAARALDAISLFSSRVFDGAICSPP
jgi:hypothetical protein